jgi:hypothetical protein
LKVAFLIQRRITSWPAQQQREQPGQQQREQQKRQQPVREQREQQQQREQQPVREQQLLLFCHKRPEQQQR